MPRYSIRDEVLRAAEELELESKRIEDTVLTDEQKTTAALAAHLIDLSRDMRRPGAPFSEAGRIERLIKAIKDEL